MCEFNELDNAENNVNEKRICVNKSFFLVFNENVVKICYTIVGMVVMEISEVKVRRNERRNGVCGPILWREFTLSFECISIYVEFLIVHNLQKN